MLLFVFLVLTFIPWNGALGKQIPVVEGTLGGVPASLLSTVKRPQSLRKDATTPGKLRVVENSGICETTPGVFQASGYGDLTATESIWFWFFAARNKPDTAPLALWFNGGPGSSSMIGLFREHGPCRITNDSSAVTLNPFSWNNEANVLYIDQPVGVGFSQGDLLKIGTSKQAAADVWTFLQIFLSDSGFAKYQASDLAIWTESYSGHYGPVFAVFFLSQNAGISAGTVSGLKQVLGIGNGLTDPLVQYPGYITYAVSNPYHPLVFFFHNQARQVILEVIKGLQGSDNLMLQGSLELGDYNAYYVLAKDPDPHPPSITNYLNSIGPSVGAEVTWKINDGTVYGNFAATGDWMRNSRPYLETVRTIIYAGDADYIVNFKEVEAMVNSLSTRFTNLFQQQVFRTYTVAGQAAGVFKNAGTFSYARIFGAGHEVPAYKFGNLAYGQAAAQMFTQIMAGRSLTPT